MAQGNANNHEAYNRPRRHRLQERRAVLGRWSLPMRARSRGTVSTERRYRHAMSRVESPMKPYQGTINMNKSKFIWLSVVFVALLAAACGRKNEQIAADVQSKVSAAAPGATASVKDGVVTLSGQVESEAAKSIAEQTAREIKGVKNVLNNITVKPAAVAAAPEKVPPPLFEADDAKLKTAVMAHMEKYNVSGVDVAVQNGEVKLTGNIKREKLQDAMKAANEAKPKKVINEMNIQ
jgi:hyperosmotically inducible protein